MKLFSFFLLPHTYRILNLNHTKKERVKTCFAFGSDEISHQVCLHVSAVTEQSSSLKPPTGFAHSNGSPRYLK